MDAGNYVRNNVIFSESESKYSKYLDNLNRIQTLVFKCYSFIMKFFRICNLVKSEFTTFSVWYPNSAKNRSVSQQNNYHCLLNVLVLSYNIMVLNCFWKLVSYKLFSQLFNRLMLIIFIFLCSDPGYGPRRSDEFWHWSPPTAPGQQSGTEVFDFYFNF
jgi:hypothetical protein